MATLIPFKGLLYNPNRIPDLSLVVTPPYDVITPEKDEEYRRRHPHNVVHLILPRPGGGLDRYQSAAALLASWRQDEILVRDEKPAFYLVSQRYTVKGLGEHSRFGLIGRLKIEEEGSAAIRPHERTMSGPRTDRTDLLEATCTNLSPIFLLHSDADGSVSRHLESVSSHSPDRWAVDDSGTESSLWRISDPALIARLAKALSDRTLWIADGHHRYSAARAHRDKARESAAPGTESRSYDYVMASLTVMESDGVTILPYHRALRGLERFSRQEMVASARRFFEVKEFPFEGLEHRAEQVRRRLRDGERSGRNAIAACTGSGSFLLLLLRQDLDLDDLFADGARGPLRRLDVSVLHHVLLDRVLGIPPGRQKEEDGPLRFTADIDRALSWVDSGEAQVALLLNATRREQLVEVADAGLQMPQKSTYFYPKMLTGLVFNPLDPAEEVHHPSPGAAAGAR